MPTDIFTTPAAAAEAEVVIKKSRFIGHVFPIHSIDEAENHLVTVRTNHKAANHNCFAYSVGLAVPVERFSDDGEPSGTAGRPILEVIRKQGLANTLVVVTRYFGGTLLGAGGLVRAYTDATVAAIDASKLLSCQKLVRCDIATDYAQFGKLEYELAQLPQCHVTHKEFGEDVVCTAWIPVPNTEGLLESVANWTSGQAHVSTAKPQWVGIDNHGGLTFDVWQSEAED